MGMNSESLNDLPQIVQHVKTGKKISPTSLFYRISCLQRLDDQKLADKSKSTIKMHSTLL